MESIATLTRRTRANQVLPLPALVKRIGNTPLLRLERVTQGLPETVSVWAKAEYLNPGGSVKDRPALRMLLEGIRSGKLDANRSLIDATSGNTGIAYAMLGAAFGIPVTLTIPSNASPERKQILRSYGANLVLTDPMDGTDGAQRVAREMVGANPEAYFYPDQYNNEANWQAHFEGTGAEILRQLEGTVTHFVAGLGTTGTFTGVTRRLKQHNPDVQAIAVQPDGPLHGLEGLKHLPTAMTPGIYDASLPDSLEWVSTEDAQHMTRRLCREEGMLVGVSSGANVAAALRVARQLEHGVVVTILCDTGTRYLSDPFWNED